MNFKKSPEFIGGRQLSSGTIANGNCLLDKQINYFTRQGISAWKTHGDEVPESHSLWSKVRKAFASLQTVDYIVNDLHHGALLQWNNRFIKKRLICTVVALHDNSLPIEGSDDVRALDWPESRVWIIESSGINTSSKAVLSIRRHSSCAAQLAHQLYASHQSPPFERSLHRWSNGVCDADLGWLNADDCGFVDSTSRNLHNKRHIF